MNWLIDITKHLTTISAEPISVQYDQTLNRLNDLFNEIQLKLSGIQEINSTMNGNHSSEHNRLQLIKDLENTKENIKKLIYDREQIQITVQTLDREVSCINQNIKTLRTKFEQSRLSNKNIEEVQVKENKSIHLLSVFF